MRIHILGASGSGTTTLARALSEKLKCPHFDSDNYFWHKTEPPFTQKREVFERQSILKIDLENSSDWILSGSLCGWGDVFVPYFDLVVYLYLPKEIRMDRLKKREQERFGKAIEESGPMYQQHLDFMEWANSYDTGSIDMRSRALHELWLSQLKCSVLILEGDISIEERVKKVFERIYDVQISMDGIKTS